MAIIIRTAEDFARVLSAPPDPEIQSLLRAHADRLAEYDDYDLSELAMFAIVQPGDDLKAINAAISWSLLDSDGAFSKPVELIALHEKWIEATFILSDDGFGLVLFVSINEATNRMLIAACERVLTQQHSADFP